MDIAWKVSKYGVSPGPYFPVFLVESKYWKIRTRKNSSFGHFLRSGDVSDWNNDNNNVINNSNDNNSKEFCIEKNF